jgi:hypothetical protein
MLLPADNNCMQVASILRDYLLRHLAADSVPAKLPATT